MKKIVLFTGFLVLAYSHFALAVTPNNIEVNCQFEGSKTIKKCHAEANFHFQGGADDHLLVNCPGLGQNTIVYNDDAEYSNNDEVIINPEGSALTPMVVLPEGAFSCHQTPRDFEALLVLPGRSPYFGAELDGECHVVTAGCGGPN